MSRAPAFPPPGPDHLLLVLRELGEAAGLFEQVFASRIGLARTDLQVLSLLAARGPQTAGQLAEATGLTTGAITGVIDRLDRAGYARRAPDPGDRRRVMVELRLERLLPLQQLNEPLHRAIHALDAEFPAAQRLAISDYVRRASAHFRAEAEALRGGPPPQGAGLTRPAAPRPPRTRPAPPPPRGPARAGSTPGSPPRRSASPRRTGR